eukprot:TRINITY_DN67564_c12_g4_i1.p1 TRINITY_DN67564_c12_g4~~TRINITY_DN67564_c12_g4_i1.p1  ORF type:complete len:443 (-),score=46.85 TRINITY_DN67564_c12_g4_i1:1402-2730(-)
MSVRRRTINHNAHTFRLVPPEAPKRDTPTRLTGGNGTTILRTQKGLGCTTTPLTPVPRSYDPSNPEHSPTPTQPHLPPVHPTAFKRGIVTYNTLTPVPPASKAADNQHRKNPRQPLRFVPIDHSLAEPPGGPPVGVSPSDLCDPALVAWELEGFERRMQQKSEEQKELQHNREQFQIMHMKKCRSTSLVAKLKGIPVSRIKSTLHKQELPGGSVNKDGFTIMVQCLVPLYTPRLTEIDELWQVVTSGAQKAAQATGATLGADLVGADPHRERGPIQHLPIGNALSELTMLLCNDVYEDVLANIFKMLDVTKQGIIPTSVAEELLEVIKEDEKEMKERRRASSACSTSSPSPAAVKPKILQIDDLYKDYPNNTDMSQALKGLKTDEKMNMKCFKSFFFQRPVLLHHFSTPYKQAHSGLKKYQASLKHQPQKTRSDSILSDWTG